MRPANTRVVLALLLAFVALGFASTRPSSFGGDPQKTNLKVLPKDLSDGEMDMLMERYTRQLGVDCHYCHVSTKPGVLPVHMDFTSDEKPEKLIARRMIKMCITLNRKYFGVKDYREAVLKPKLTCKNCHQGFPRPSSLK